VYFFCASNGKQTASVIAVINNFTFGFTPQRYEKLSNFQNYWPLKYHKNLGSHRSARPDV
jgi:hypothetical protein